MTTYSSVAFNDTSKPERFGVKRDETYDLKMGRYTYSNSMGDKHKKFIEDAHINTQFWLGNQWIIREDVDSFLKDEDNNTRNRIKVVHNKLIPIVSQYVGNALNMDLSFKAVNISPGVINRRESSLAEMFFFTELANNSSPSFAAYLRETMPIGKDLVETESIHDNFWVDSFSQSVNLFDNAIEKETKMNDLREEVAQSVALTGLGGLRYDFHNGDFVVELVDVENYWFDHQAKLKDLSDAGHMGDFEDLIASELFERYNKIPEERKKQIEEQLDLSDNDNMGRVRVVRSHWKDWEKQDFGWVSDPFGYPWLVHLTDDGYGEKDLLPVEQLNDSQKEITKGKNRATIYVDILRYCHWIPYEFGVSAQTSGGKNADIYLEGGVYKYQDTETYRIYNVNFPYKMATWYYHKGYVFTPITALINPQRFINRISSVAENIINTTLPKNLVYDEFMVGDKKEFLSNAYQGIPNGIDTKGLGINNLVGMVGSGFDDSVNGYVAMAENMANSMDRMIGVNESLRGENQGANKLVGVTALEIQRASIAQEPFYDAISSVYGQVHSSIVNVARRVYADNGRRLAILVGDRHASSLVISKEYNIEDFRMYVKRVADPDQVKELLRAKLDNWLLNQIISKAVYAKYWENPSDEKLADALREQVMIETETAKMQQEAEAEAAQAEQAELEDERDVQEARQDVREQDLSADAQAERDNKLNMKMIDARTQNLAENQLQKENG